MNPHAALQHGRSAPKEPIHALFATATGAAERQSETDMMRASLTI